MNASPSHRKTPDLAFYGDDLTGSTDVLEALTLAGKRATLFLAPPTLEALSALPDLDAIGIAGTSRAQSPEWMDAQLPAIFEALRTTGAPLIHYKICSTFDSAPEIGNIGRVIDIGLSLFGGSIVPIIVGVPRLGRYSAFGQLFATYKGLSTAAHRIDRHPVMSLHPKTPMREADLVRHLAGQTHRAVELIDFRALKADGGVGALRAVQAKRSCAVLIDVLDAETSAAAGRLLRLAAAETPPLFVIGSSGVEYAWLDSEPKPVSHPDFARPGAVEQMLVVSGSGSRTTAGQIGFAEAAGWSCLAADTLALADASKAQGEIDHLLNQASMALEHGRSVAVHTVSGPDDPRLEETSRALAASNQPSADLLGRPLGMIAAELLGRSSALRRVVVAGGDTSGAAADAMGIVRLDILAPAVPGSPLCLAHATRRAVNGIEIAFKGGQVGADDCFERIRLGLTDRDPLPAPQPSASFGFGRLHS